MSITIPTARKIIAMKGKCYPTYKGSLYRAINAYQGDYHCGWIVQMIIPDKGGGRPQFSTYVDKIPFVKTVTVNKSVAANIISMANHFYVTEMNKYKAFPVYDGRGNLHGWAIYKYKSYYRPRENNKYYIMFIPSQPKDYPI